MGSSNGRISLAVRLLAFMVAVVGYARLGPPRDARSGILDSSLIVIVKPDTTDNFTIEQRLLGKAPQDGKIHLAGFTLFTYQDEKTDLVEPITPSTRILLFLKQDRANPGRWEITGSGYCFFWVRDPRQLEELRKIADGAISLRRGWESARDRRGPEERLEALWPYFWNEQGYFFSNTLTEFEKMKPAAGDYVATQFDSLTAMRQEMLLGYAGALGGEKLHRVVIDYIKKADAGAPANSASASPDLHPTRTVGPRPKVPERDMALPADRKIAAGIDGLITFQNRADLPYIQDLARSAIRRHYDRTCYSALTAFMKLPDPSNLRIIDEISSARIDQVPMVSPTAIVKSLSNHKYPETVPILARFLTDKTVAAETERALTEIAGRDLGSLEQPWLDWFKARTAQR